MKTSLVYKLDFDQITLKDLPHSGGKNDWLVNYPALQIRLLPSTCCEAWNRTGSRSLKNDLKVTA